LAVVSYRRVCCRVALGEASLQLGLGAGAGEHCTRASECERAYLRRRGARLGGVEQRLGEGERSLHLWVAGYAQARMP
jgi:hypothetical protein